MNLFSASGHSRFRSIMYFRQNNMSTALDNDSTNKRFPVRKISLRDHWRSSAKTLLIQHSSWLCTSAYTMNTRGTYTTAKFVHNKQQLVVRDKVGRPPGELGVSKSMECDIFPSVLWHCRLGDRKGIRPIKNWMLVCWWWFDFVWLIAPVVQLSPPPPIILCFNKHRLTQVHLENGH